ncbi:Hypothetical predicted protein [Mytilus galloprovincialis]|uniref:Uncharacterized protein n=1 Tax=Mytilus galloprovincialis TaxID=29158 RepID=A0A8B6GYQ3_MYTGA|nr:Hypothetical predicted protein [Mytilus galloprovincialis]
MKVNSLGVALRSATEVRNKWRNTTRVAKVVYTTHRREVFKTGRGPAPKQHSSAVERVIHLMKDTTCFRGIQGGLETESFQSSNPQSPSLLTGYDPILNTNSFPRTNKWDRKAEDSENTFEKGNSAYMTYSITVLHDIQYRAQEASS